MKLTFSPLRSYAWTQRVCGFLILYLVTFGWFTLRPRLPPKNVKGGMFNFGAFKTPTFSLYVAGCFLIMLGYAPFPSAFVIFKHANIRAFLSASTRRCHTSTSAERPQDSALSRLTWSRSPMRARSSAESFQASA